MATLPLDRLISTKLTFLKKEEKFNKDMASYSSRSHRSVPVHDNEELARESGLLLLDELEFPHAIF